MIEEVKQSRAVKMRATRVIHELNEFCKPNPWTESFTWRAEMDDSGSSGDLIRIHGNYTIDKLRYFKDAVVLCNPVSKYFAEYNKISVWDVLKTWTDWTTVIRYAKFDPEPRGPSDWKPRELNREDIRDNLGMEPIGDVLTRKNGKGMSMEEYEWWHWIERDRKDEWNGDWYIFESVYLLRLYGQLLTALDH